MARPAMIRREGSMTKGDGIRMHQPVHPGSFVKHEVLQPLGLSVTDGIGSINTIYHAIKRELRPTAR